MKKIFALIVAMVMIIATMNFGTFAAVNDTTPDTTLKITGLDEGDTVNIYQVLEWVDGDGWKLVSPFNTAAGEAVLAKINARTELDQNDVTSLSKLVKGQAGGGLSGTADADGNFEATANVVPAMYIALVKPIKVGTIYNPIIISADYNTENGTKEIDASSATLPSSDTTGEAIAKKSTVTVKKEADDYTHNSNNSDGGFDDPVNFTITTTIPAYSKQFTAPKFIVKDELSKGLELDTESINVVSGNVGYTIDPKTSSGFTVTFTPADILALAAPQEVTITYSAYFTNEAPYTVNEEDNDVTVTFSNNPQNENDFKELHDKTRHYTFSIDGSLFGLTSYKTGEVVKIGKDSQGNVIESYRELSNGSEHGALKGAVFGLYPDGTTDFSDANLYKNKNYPNGCKITTDEDGLMEINGLDVGTYILKEISAPKGYIKDSNPHTIVINATIKEEPITENGETYTVPVLKSYTITVDNTESSYTMTLDGPEISSVTPGDSSAEIVNTKGVELPATGGIGTTIFYAIGTILVLGAGILLVTRRRMKME